MDFWQFRAATRLYYSQGGATKLSLCDPGREFSVNTPIFSQVTEPELL